MNPLSFQTFRSEYNNMCYSHYGNGVCNGAISIGQYPKGANVDAYGAQIVRVAQIPECLFVCNRGDTVQ